MFECSGSHLPVDDHDDDDDDDGDVKSLADRRTHRRT